MFAMSFADAIANLHDAIDAFEMGSTVTYTPDGGEGTPVVIEALGLEYGAGESGGRGALLEVRQSDVPEPVYRDKVVIGSVEWRLARPRGKADWEGIPGDSWKLPLVRDQRPNPLRGGRR